MYIDSPCLIMTTLDSQPRVDPGAQANSCDSHLAQLPVSATNVWLAALLRTAMDGVVISDSQMRIVLLNSEAERLFGYRSDQLLGQGMDMLLSAESLERFRQAGAGTVRAEKIQLEGLRGGVARFRLDLSLSSVIVDDLTYTVASVRECLPATMAERRRALSYHHSHELEKRRFSHELYNELGQRLSVLKQDMDWLEQTVQTGQNLRPERISHMQALLDNAILRTRTIASDLRPPLLDDFGLLAAVRWITHAFEKRTGIRCAVDSNIGAISGGDAVDSAVYRVVQECLLNVERHAHASRVHVWMRCDGGQMAVLVQDNGAGMPGNAEYKTGCFGLAAMQERIYTLGGNMDICSRQQRGSAIYVTLPIEPPVVKIS